MVMRRRRVVTKRRARKDLSERTIDSRDEAIRLESSRCVSGLERRRRAEAARLKGFADRWLSQSCGHSQVGSADR